MKYIRTRDGRILEVDKTKTPYIYKIKPNKKGVYEEIGNGWIYRLADTIEELCDEFVYRNQLYNKIEKGKDLENQTSIRLFGSSFFDLYIEEWEDIYGAIWTDKGLIYVAKMNDKGELEIL